MTDNETLYLVLVVLYLLEGAAWVPRGSIALCARSSEWALPRLPHRTIGNARGGAVLGFPFLSGATVFIVPQWPVSLSPQGVLFWVAESMEMEERAAHSGNFFRFDALHDVSADGRAIWVNDEAICEVVSPAMARQIVIKVKQGAQEVQAAEDTGALERYENGMRAALSGMLLPDFFTDMQLTPDTETATTGISGTLHFEGAVQPGAVAARLGFLSGKQVQAAGPAAASVQGRIAGTGLAPRVVAQRFKTALADAPDLPPLSEPLVESTTIGSRVGTELRDSALRALLLSFVAIVIYIRVRFREYRFGFAAVIALIHDVLITLGVVSLAHQFGMVDIELDLAMIAAFLTIIGYSLNDTIVLFDRIRENMPRMEKPLAEVINVSMNQVLARSLLTSVTVLLTLLVIFFMNVGQQNVLEGFSFAMIVGILVGTYSSIYVASPLLLLFTRRAEGKAT
jgi:preprotein translocase SecF subunit